MSTSSTFGTPTYGPFSDGTVQTYFRYTPEHVGKSGQLEVDVQLVKPSPLRDETLGHKIGSIPVDK